MTVTNAFICVAVIISEAIFLPLYLKKMWPIKNYTSLCYKMICATGYLVIGITAYAAQNPPGSYARYMLIAFACSWIGDVLLHIPKPSKSYFLIGMLFFATAHLFFCISYILVQQNLCPDMPAILWWEVALMAVLQIAFFSITYLNGVRYGKIAIAGVIYGIFIFTMIIKSTELCLMLLIANARASLAPALLLLVGGFSFVVSDGSLSLIMFDTRFKKFRLKIFNMVTYFAAQICLAMTVFFIN